MVIETKKLQEVSSSRRQLFEKARGAIAQKNYAYAFQMLRELLSAEPGLFEARMVLRQAQLERVDNKVSQVRQFTARLKTFPSVNMKGPGLLKKGKVAEALDVAEQAMEHDPTLMPTINFLAKAAQEAGLINVAVNTLEIGVRFNPKNVQGLRDLATLYAKAGEDGKALQVRQQICELRPSDLGAQTELKQATAMAAMKEGKWNEAESYRDVIRDKEQAQTLEQQERLAARDEETLLNLIKSAEAAVAENATAATHKRLADLYHQKKDFDKALEQYDLVVEKTGTMDPAIDAAITRVLSDRFDDAMEQWRAYGEQDESRKEEAEQKAAEIQQQKDETVFTRAKARVERYPTDANFHFQLGELHLSREEYDDALGEFQAAQRSPQLKRKAYACMGKCLSAKELFDLAVEQFKSALEGAQTMDRDKKDCLYHLGLAYEGQENREAAADCFKQIYAADVNYLDVSTRIESHYKS